MVLESNGVDGSVNEWIGSNGSDRNGRDGSRKDRQYRKRPEWNRATVRRFFFSLLEQRRLPLQYPLLLGARFTNGFLLAHLGGYLAPAGEPSASNLAVVGLALNADDLVPPGTHGADHLRARTAVENENSARTGKRR